MRFLYLYLLLWYFLYSSCTMTKQASYFNLYKASVVFDSTIYVDISKDSFSLLISTHSKDTIALPKHLPQWIAYQVDTLPSKLIQLSIKIDSNADNMPRKAILPIGSSTIHILQKANTLLAQFIDYNPKATCIDITLQKDTQQILWKNLPITQEGKIYYPNHIDTTIDSYRLVSALFKNKHNMAIDWWDYEAGIALNTTIHLYDTLFRFAGGNGSPRLPYLVANPLQLNAIREKGCNPNRVIYFKQIKDIDLSDAIGINAIVNDSHKIIFMYQNGYALFNHQASGWIPIGDEENPFTGYYQGNGKTIDGLCIKNNLLHQIGLFGKTNPSATIERLSIGKNSFLYNHYNYEDTAITYTNMGSIAGENNGNIIQCKTEASLYSEDENNTGGIVGFNYGIIAGCMANNLYINSYVSGGIVGFNYGHIASSTSTRNTIEGNIAGGMAGYNSHTISTCHSDSNTIAATLYGGSLAGYNSNNIIASYATYNDVSKASHEANIGLLSGFNNLSGDITACYTMSKNDLPLIGSNQNEKNIPSYNLQAMTTEVLFNNLYNTSYTEFQLLNPNATTYEGSTIWKNTLYNYPVLWWE